MIFLERNNSLMLFKLDKSQYSQKGAVVFILVYLFATIFGAILTPPLYWLTEYTHYIFPQNETLIYLLDKGVDKYFDRLRWLGVIIGLPFLFKYTALNSFKDMGLSIDKSAIKIFLKYFALGIAVMGFLYFLQMIFTDVSLKPISFSGIIAILLRAALGGFILGLLEEIVFRGLIFRSFYTAWGALPAIIFTSAFFAYKHFKIPDETWNGFDVHSAHWYTGFKVALYDGVAIFYGFNPLVFLSLFVLSALLCTFYIKTKSLYSCIAFHTAVVFSLQAHRKIFSLNEDNLRFFFGNSTLINSYICVIILSILLIFTIFSIKKRPQSS